MRYTCEQDFRFGFVKSDGRNYAKEVFIDKENGYNLMASYLKKASGISSKLVELGEWALRIEGKPNASSKQSSSSISLIFNVAHQFNQFKWISDDNYFTGKTAELGEFRIYFDVHNGYSKGSDYRYSGVNVESGDIWKSKDIVIGSMHLFALEKIQSSQNYPPPNQLFLLPNKVDEDANHFSIQNIFSGSFIVKNNV
ncbi:hypothetical protein O9G_003125 [Rozella allomycis CSF55]|uniref:Mannosyl-oligosaccharide glucosidase n=1 Tax=Rozella allomycis (strain CSF55) TaxID=988480 RepID=A0A075AS61_ROZAC|nr:hypothetical protein O9G_003125 [Rozella allomycis CSF55]|eukprot:EPZ31403.1 hypothetical protein O9G_003125 [Rozella allomycis CSF55]